jgi:hypothetical protein
LEIKETLSSGFFCFRIVADRGEIVFGSLPNLDVEAPVLGVFHSVKNPIG